jgi:hypothetical protein
MIGPPVAGKTMLAKRLPTEIPPLALAEALETTKIHSMAGKIGKETSLMTIRPFRSPQHTISDVAAISCVVNYLILKNSTGSVFKTVFIFCNNFDFILNGYFWYIQKQDRGNFITLIIKL